MGQGIVGFELQCLAVVGNRLVPGLVAGELNRSAAIPLGCLRKTRRCNHQCQKQESPHDHSLARQVGRKPSFLYNVSAQKKFAGEASSPAREVTYSFYHQMNFALTCPTRKGRALVTFPKSLWLMLPPGLLNWAWLNTLKNSPRISKDLASVIGIVFCIPKSVLMMPGPWKNRRLAVPNVPHSGLGLPFVSKVQEVFANAL